jgi:hypothetical protein
MHFMCSIWLLSDGADGADAPDILIGRVPYADDPISGSTLATKCNVEGNVCARRNRPARALPFLGQLRL